MPDRSPVRKLPVTEQGQESVSAVPTISEDIKTGSALKQRIKLNYGLLP
jgi:hypothetical protein